METAVEFVLNGTNIDVHQEYNQCNYSRCKRG